MIPGTRTSRFRIAGAAFLAAVLAVVGVLALAQRRALDRNRALRETDVAAGPRVRTFVVGRPEGDAPRVFQGEALPWSSTTLYAKLGGFLKEIRVDKGSRVARGEVLAILESPETAKQTQALKAAYENLQRTADKYAQLGRQGIASALDVDNAQTAARVARETWLSQAEVEGYQTLAAPFAGVVTARYVDPGAFIQNASSSTASQPIVTVSDVTRLRVAFFLDQAAAAQARVGQEVDVSPAHRPDLVRSGRISRLSGALDLRTRTMLAEADLDNRDGAFLGGGYVKVALRLPRDRARTEIPAEALLMKGEQAFAVAVEAGKARVLPLVLGEDAGSRVRVLRGLGDGVRIVLNPGAELRDGDPLQVVD